MRLVHLFEGFSWRTAKADAASRGLELAQNNKRWILSLPESDKAAFIEKAKQAGLSPAPVDQYGYQYTWMFVNSNDYAQNADKLEMARDNPTQVFANIKEQLVSKAWDELQRVKARVSSYARPGRFQLFVPRPQIFREYYPDAPVLRNVPVGWGSAKPSSAFWTSTLEFSYEKDGKKYYSSEWVDWIENANMPKWWNPVGLFIHTSRLQISTQCIANMTLERFIIL